MTDKKESDQLTRLLENQSLRWSQGERVLVEVYLAENEPLGRNRDQVLDLIYHEMHLREQFGEAADLAEYVRRFPHLEADLRRGYDVHRPLVQKPNVLLNTGPRSPQKNAGPMTTVPPRQQSGMQMNSSANIPSDQPACRRFRIVEQLGAGGMGVVYRAKDLVLKRDVALKVIRADALTPEMLQQFLKEAQAVAALDHPGIVKVFDVGEWAEGDAGPEPYLSLELVASGSLSQCLGGKKLDVREAAKLVRLLAKAMAHAHSRGVVHRDLKLDNVLMADLADEPSLNCALGCPKISDFGLARRIAGECKTQPGGIVGTPGYMAPEQIAGQQVGPPADVFSLGVILYRLLTGKMPFHSDSRLAMLEKVCREEPAPVRHFRPEVPAALEAICVACMCKDAAKRPTMAELAAQLEPLSEVTPKRGLAQLFGLVALVLVGLGAWVLWPRGSGPVAGVAEPAALTGTLTVRVWAKDRGVHGLEIGKDIRAVPVHEDEGIQVEVNMNEPAYVFLLIINGKGETTPLFPWNEDRIDVDDVDSPPPARKVASLRSPPAEDKAWAMDEKVGLDTVVLLARRDPWPVDKKLGEQIGKLPGAPMLDLFDVRMWDGSLKREMLSLDGKRIKKEVVEIDDQFQRLAARLSRDFAVIRAVQFTHAAKRKP